MRNLKRALAAVFVLLLAAVVLFFVLENQQTVSLVLFGWAAPAMPVVVGRCVGQGPVEVGKRKIRPACDT